MKEKEDYWDNKLRGTVMYHSIKEIFNKINHIPYAIVKGEPLSMMAYGMPGCRNSRDIDILVHRENLYLIEGLLTHAGYFASANNYNIRGNRLVYLCVSHQLPQYHNATKSVFVDLNFDVFWGEYDGKRIDINDFLSDTIEMNIHGVKVKTLSPIKMLLHLILHHYRDMNSIFLLATRNSINKNMFKDVFNLLMNNMDVISIKDLLSISEKYDIVPYAYYVLYYTNKVYCDRILEKYVQAFRTKDGEKLLNCYGLCTEERKIWKYDFETRLESEDLYSLIEADLNDKDHQKISINKGLFGGGNDV